VEISSSIEIALLLLIALASCQTQLSYLSYLCAGSLKAVYLAPAKALVQEKAAEWTQKFGRALNLSIKEVTGKTYVCNYFVSTLPAENRPSLLFIIYLFFLLCR
jgi:replicative superfamily II helicase